MGRLGGPATSLLGTPPHDALTPPPRSGMPDARLTSSFDVDDDIRPEETRIPLHDPGTPTVNPPGAASFPAAGAERRSSAGVEPASRPFDRRPGSQAQGHAPGAGHLPGQGGPPQGMSERVAPVCTTPQLRRFIKSRAYVPMHELRRRFAIEGGDDDVTGVDLQSGRVYVGLPSQEGHLLGDLLRAGEIGCELSMDPQTPVVVGVYAMRPVPRP